MFSLTVLTLTWTLNYKPNKTMVFEPLKLSNSPKTKKRFMKTEDSSISLRMMKNPWSLGLSECNRVND